MAGTTTNPTGKRRFRRLLFGLMVLVYALLFGEFFLRLLAPQPLVSRYVTGGADGVRANIPGISFRQWTPEVDVTIRYNRAGQRDDRPPPGTRTPGDCRIALLGDSYFVGFESSFENSFANRLEQAFDRRGHPCRVVNFAVSGFGDAENLRILESRVRPFHPDLLLLSVHQTDGLDNVRANLFRIDQGRLSGTGNSYLPGVEISDRLNRYRLYRWAQENSHLYSAVREWAGATGKRLLAKLRLADADTADSSPDENPIGTDASGLPTWVGDQALNATLVEAIGREGQTFGARLLLFEIPTYNKGRYIGIIDRLLPAALLAQIPHASPLQRFRAMSPAGGPLYLTRGQRHWTARGNEVAAEVAADSILESGLLPPMAAQPTDQQADQPE